MEEKGRWLLTGPTYGDIEKFKNYIGNNFVILGDAYLNNKKTLKQIDERNTYYCVRGLDLKPKYCEELQPVYEDEIEGLIWFDPNLPFIKYFEDGEIYNLGGVRTLILGGGTDYNLKAELSAKSKNVNLDTSLTNFDKMLKRLNGKEVDLVLSYTGKVDGLEGETEDQIDEILKIIKWKHWYIGRMQEDVNASNRISYVDSDIIDFEKIKTSVEFVQEEVVKEENSDYDLTEEEILEDVE